MAVMTCCKHFRRVAEVCNLCVQSQAFYRYSIRSSLLTQNFLVSQSLDIDWKLHISGFQGVLGSFWDHFGIVLAMISKRTWRGKRKPELGWSYFSALHSIDTSCKFRLNILLSDNLKHNFHFSTTLFKNLIFEKHCVLLFCMKKILHFALPAKFCIFHEDLV